MYDETGREVPRAKFRDLMIGASVAVMLVALASPGSFVRSAATTGATRGTGTKSIVPKPRPRCPGEETGKPRCSSHRHASGFAAYLEQASLSYSIDRGDQAGHILDILV